MTHALFIIVSVFAAVNGMWLLSGLLLIPSIFQLLDSVYQNRKLPIPKMTKEEEPPKKQTGVLMIDDRTIKNTPVVQTPHEKMLSEMIESITRKAVDNGYHKTDSLPDDLRV